jgi:hypothetical protein
MAPQETAGTRPAMQTVAKAKEATEANEATEAMPGAEEPSGTRGADGRSVGQHRRWLKCRTRK